MKLKDWEEKAYAQGLGRNGPEKRQPEYQKPTLIIYGDVRDVTLGGTQGPGDPGAPGGTRRP